MKWSALIHFHLVLDFIDIYQIWNSQYFLKSQNIDIEKFTVNKFLNYFTDHYSDCNCKTTIQIVRLFQM